MRSPISGRKSQRRTSRFALPLAAPAGPARTPADADHHTLLRSYKSAGDAGYSNASVSSAPPPSAG